MYVCRTKVIDGCTQGCCVSALLTVLIAGASYQVADTLYNTISTIINPSFSVGEKYL